MIATIGRNAARVGALCYIAWGVFHVHVAWNIYRLGVTQAGIAQGRTFQLAAYMLTISLFVVAVAALLNWHNDRRGYWLNLCVAGWADSVWVAVAVVPGYVGLIRGLVPPAIFVAGAIATTIGYFGQKRGDEFMTSVALYVELKAKPGKEEEVAAFLAGARSLAIAEPGTVVWFAARVDKATFFIFDAFDNEAGREAHLKGPIAAALMAHADELLATAPAIHRADILADKLHA